MNKMRKLFILLFILSFKFTYAQPNKELQMRYFVQNPKEKGSEIPYGNNLSAGQYVKSDDAKIYYEVYGKGKPLVVLHGGIVGSSYQMGQFIDSLSQNHKVIVITTRGHGKSEMGISEPSYELKANDVNAVLEKVSSEKAIVLGFSDGAYTGYYFAKDFPEKIEKLIAIGAGEWKKGFRNFNLGAKDIASLDELFWKQQIALRPEPNRIDEWFVSLNKYYNNLDIGSSVFEKIKCPVLVLAGEKDQNAPLETVLKAYHTIPNAQLAIIANAPHEAFIVNFDAVWANIKPFLYQ